MFFLFFCLVAKATRFVTQQKITMICEEVATVIILHLHVYVRSIKNIANECW